MWNSEKIKVNIHTYTDYKRFVNDWVESRPGKGRGEYRAFSQYLKVSSTLISQIFKGDKELTVEQACELATYLNLEESETQYLILLVEWQRAGTTKLKQKFKQMIQEMQNKAQKARSVLKSDATLSPQTLATFYSHWLYSGIRHLADIGLSTIDELAERLKIDRMQVSKVVDFLIKEGLCVVGADGKLTIGPTKIFVDSSNAPLVSQNHKNWRLRAMDKMVMAEETQFFYTGIISLSANDAAKVRHEIVGLLKSLQNTVEKSPSEVVRCLNIDWFDY